VVESEGETTVHSIAATAEIMRRMNLKSCIVVSDGYHIYRVKKLLENQGMKVYGSPGPRIGCPSNRQAGGKTGYICGRPWPTGCGGSAFPSETSMEIGDYLLTSGWPTIRTESQSALRLTPLGDRKNCSSTLRRFAGSILREVHTTSEYVIRPGGTRSGPRTTPWSKQALSKLDPPSRTCKIEPQCGNLSAYHQGQADRIRPMHAASGPDVLRHRER